MNRGIGSKPNVECWRRTSAEISLTPRASKPRSMALIGCYWKGCKWPNNGCADMDRNDQLIFVGIPTSSSSWEVCPVTVGMETLTWCPSNMPWHGADKDGSPLEVAMSFNWSWDGQSIIIVLWLENSDRSVRIPSRSIGCREGDLIRTPWHVNEWYNILKGGIHGACFER